MPGKQLRGIRARKAITAFERAGGIRRKKGKGDHVNIKMPNGQIVTIPNKGTVKIGLLRAAIAKAGLTDEAFADLL
jgi:predicted RNA binding protein YcfA (HicA-like mRNA interferase family)